MKGIKVHILLSLIVLIASCSIEPERKKYFSPLKVNIPQELNKNADIQQFVTHTEKSINKWTNKIEDLLNDSEPYFKKKKGEFTNMDRLKILGIAGRMVTNSAILIKEIAEFDIKSKKIEKSISTDEKQAFKAVARQFKTRLIEVKNTIVNYRKKMREVEKGSSNKAKEENNESIGS